MRFGWRAFAIVAATLLYRVQVRARGGQLDVAEVLRYPFRGAGMGEQDQDHYVDVDYSGRPYRLPTVEEALSAPPPTRSPYDLHIELPDGRKAVEAADGDGGHQCYILRADGWPDWDRPVWIEGLSTGEPSPDAEVIPRPDADRT